MINFLKYSIATILGITFVLSTIFLLIYLSEEEKQYRMIAFLLTVIIISLILLLLTCALNNYLPNTLGTVIAR